ncbi:MAG TPA: DinB family protein [Clostridia bacterium]|nr:DinB family protein [Clostridia bacterium]
MDSRRSLWNAQQTHLREILLKPDKFYEAMKICLEQHSMVHSSEMSGTNVETFEDELWKDLDDTTFRTAVGVKGRTVAYGMWHSTRIEDITMNIIVAGSNQVIDSDNWLVRIKSSIYDTGNAMNVGEILEFSKNINMQELHNYRITVGRRTREIIQGLKPTDLKRKFDDITLNKIFDIGAVSRHEAASWLVDFWGKKNVAGILLMPATRHHTVHINESLSAKSKANIKHK